MILLFSQLSDTVWMRVYPRVGEQKVFRGVESNAGLVVVGYTTENGDKDVFVAEIDTLGNLLWATVQGDSGIDEVAKGVAKLPDGYLVVGWRGPVGNRDIYLVKIDTVGSVVWDTTYGVDGEEEGLYGATYDTLRGIVWGVGFKRFSWDTSYVGYIIGIDPSNGDSVKATIVNIPDAGYELLYGVAVREDGKVVAVGKGVVYHYEGVLPYFYALGFLLDTSVSYVDSAYLYASPWIPGTFYGVAMDVYMRGNYEYAFGGVYYVDDPDPLGVMCGTPRFGSFAYYFDRSFDHGILSSSLKDSTVALVGFKGNLTYTYDVGVLNLTDTTEPYADFTDTTLNNSGILIAMMEKFWLFCDPNWGFYDFPRTDVGAGVRFVEGDSLDLLIGGYSNSFSTDTSDYDLIALRVRPERLGVDERPRYEAIVEGKVRIYDASGRLIYVGEYDRAKVGRGVFFVVGKGGVRKVIRR